MSASIHAAPTMVNANKEQLVLFYLFSVVLQQKLLAH